MEFKERWKHVVANVKNNYGKVSCAFDYLKDKEVYQNIVKHGGYIWCCQHGQANSVHDICPYCKEKYLVGKSQ